jgi:hypothetical protein
MSKEKHKDKIISVGDLVRLADDSEIQVGLGLVLEEKQDNREIVEDFSEQHSDFFLEEIPEFLLFKPVYLVLWHGEAISPISTPVWMFKTELVAIKKEVAALS